MKILVGGYTNSKLGGINLIDSENDYERTLIGVVGNPSYLYCEDNYVYSVSRSDQTAGFIMFKYDGEYLKRIGSNLHQSVAPCYITKIDKLVYTCNYHEGTLTIYDETFRVISQIYESNGKCHFIIRRTNLNYVFFLGTDNILVFSNTNNKTFNIKFPKGSGPRHGVVKTSSNMMYVLCECSNEIYSVDENLSISLLIKTTINDEVESSSAAIRLSSDENYLYVSNRGEDTICIYKIYPNKLELIQAFKLPTKGPRDFQLVDDKIIIANQFSNIVSIYKIENYLITDLIKEVSVYKPTCIAILN